MVVFRGSATVMAVVMCLLFSSLSSSHALVSKRQTGATRAQLADICDRRYAMTTVVGNRLYLNGGQNMINRTQSVYDYENFNSLQYIDLSSSWSIASPPVTTKSKPSTLTNVNEGCAWSDGIEFYQYGGWQITEETQEDFRVWDYDVSAESWIAVSTDSSNVQRLASGGYTNAPPIKKSYAFGGFLDGATTNDPFYARTGPLRDFVPRADVIEFDWETKKAANITYTDKTGRDLKMVDNSLLYVPVIGGSGILISLGGRSSLFQEGYSQMPPMTEIRFFDIASSTWYRQSAVAASPGDSPPPRVEPCVTVQPAPDSSSFNVYMFGGSAADFEYAALNDVWILSLPSFKWIKVTNTADDNNQIPETRTSHSCHIIGNRQMAVIGGGRNIAAHKQCTNSTLFIFDTSTLSWRANFNPDEEAYVVPKAITDVIGGDEGGNADPEKNKPSSWTDAAIPLLFGLEVSPTTTENSPATNSTSSTTSEPASTSETSAGSPTPAGAIAGGVVGGIIGLAVLGAIGVLFIRRRRRQRMGFDGRTTSATPLGPTELGVGNWVQELEAEYSLHEMQAPIPKGIRPSVQTEGLEGEEGVREEAFKGKYSTGNAPSELHAGDVPHRPHPDGLVVKLAQVIPSPISSGDQSGNTEGGLDLSNLPGLPGLPSPPNPPNPQNPPNPPNPPSRPNLPNPRLARKPLPERPPGGNP